MNETLSLFSTGNVNIHYSNNNNSINNYDGENVNATTTSMDELYLSIENRPLSTISIVFAILFSLVLLFGLFTNAIVVLVFVVKSEFRQYTNYFFANLSISDMLVLVVCIPVAITDLFSPDIWNYGRIYCKKNSCI